MFSPYCPFHLQIHLLHPSLIIYSSTSNCSSLRSSSVTCPLRRGSSLSSSGSSFQTTNGESFWSRPSIFPPPEPPFHLRRVYPCTRPDFFTLYLEEPDKAGHSYGPNGTGVSLSEKEVERRGFYLAQLTSDVRSLVVKGDVSEEHLPFSLPLISTSLRCSRLPLMDQCLKYQSIKQSYL